MGGTQWYAHHPIVVMSEVKKYRGTMEWTAFQRVPVDREKRLKGARDTDIQKTEIDRNHQRTALLAVVVACSLILYRKTASQIDIEISVLATYILVMYDPGQHQANTDAANTGSAAVQARTGASEGAAAPEAPETPGSSLARDPGRPRGYPKTGGRKRGSKNRRTKEVEEALRPLVPAAKRKLKALMDAEDEKVAYSACMGVLSYVFGKPIDRQQIGGIPGGEPVGINDGKPIDDRELARRIALILDKADKDTKPAASAAPTPAQDKDTKADVDARPDTEDKAAEPLVPKPGEQAIVGESVIGDFGVPTVHPIRVLNQGPDRDGLPDKFAIIREAMVVKHMGDFGKALAWVREKFNLADAPIRIEAVGPDQMPFAVGSIEITRGYPEKKN